MIGIRGGSRIRLVQLGFHPTILRLHGLQVPNGGT